VTGAGGGGEGAVVDAVVLAGGVDRGELAAQTGVPYRPLLEVAGRPLILHVLGALGRTTGVDRVAVVGPPAVLEAADELMVDFRVPAGEHFLGNLLAGISTINSGRANSSPNHVLVITGDLPLITPAAVDDFVERSLAAYADVTYPIIPKASCERQFPGGRRTYVRLREGVFTGGNAVVLTRQFVEQSKELIGRLYAYRKNPIRLATLFGPGFILGLVLGRLTISALEGRASTIVGGRVRAIVSEHPDLGFDVDKLEDLVIAREVAAGVMAGEQ